MRPELNKLYASSFPYPALVQCTIPDVPSMAEYAECVQIAPILDIYETKWVIPWVELKEVELDKMLADVRILFIRSLFVSVPSEKF
jgi:hypothetical protein